MIRRRNDAISRLMEKISMTLFTIKSYQKFITLLLVCCLSACTTVNLVQPYDADLYNNTEAFYKNASAMIAKGISVSPKTSEQLLAIADDEKAQHPGHYRQFYVDYNSLLIESNALILRSLANSQQLDNSGQAIQQKIEAVISESLPTECDSLQQSFPSVSLTTRNYIDLKCLVGRWSEAHQGHDPNGDITRGKQILKQAAWEGRAKSLFDGILAIQTAEASKK